MTKSRNRATALPQADGTDALALAQSLARGVFREISGGDVALARTPYDDFADYKRRLVPSYPVNAPHLQLLDKVLMDVEAHIRLRRRGRRHLLISMPPRHYKTLTASLLFSTWMIGRNPSKRVMLVGYSHDFAMQALGSPTLKIVETEAYQDIFHHKLRASAQSLWDFEGHNGYVTCMGRDGATSGKGADLLILDDPIKNYDEAQSERLRNTIYDGFLANLYTRLEPNGSAAIVIMTRWHHDDLYGRLKAFGYWDEIRMPAIATGDTDALGRAEGELLFPERFDSAEMERIRTTIGPYLWNAMYQQSPTAQEGEVFKPDWFKVVFFTPNDIVRQVRFWDLAMSNTERSDYTAGVRLGVTKDGKFVVTDIFRKRIAIADLHREIAVVMRADGSEVYQGYEAAGHMASIMKDMNRDSQLSQIVIRGYKSDRDKRAAAAPVASRAMIGNFYVLQRAWLPEFLDELVNFPRGKHDDQVDALSGAYKMLNETITIEAKSIRYV